VKLLHEFLRRAILSASTGQHSWTVGGDENEVALASAITLSQIGMLYLGSPRLLRSAKVQQSSLVEIACSLACSISTRPVTMANTQTNNGYCTQDAIWKRHLLKDCKRMIYYTIWVRAVDFFEKVRDSLFVDSYWIACPCIISNSSHQCLEFNSQLLGPVVRFGCQHRLKSGSCNLHQNLVSS
jgi:hypothetical protein